MMSLKIFKNGQSRKDPYEFPYKADLSHARTFDQALEMLGATMAMVAKVRQSETSIGGGLSFDVTKVFTTNGKQILSLSELVSCNEIVVCGREEAYQAVSASSLTTTSHHKTPPEECKSSKFPRLNREETVSKSRSVFFHLPSPITGDEDTHNTARKTFSEMDASRMEHSLNSDTESMSPRMACSSHSQSLKPTPSKSSCESRIPRRITSGTNSTLRGSPPKAAQVSKSETLSPRNCAVRNRNINIQNSKVQTSKLERPVTPSQQEFIRPRLVTVLRHGIKPRKAMRLLLNKKTAKSWDRVLTDITDSMKPDWGAVRRVYTLNRNEVTTLEDFFGTEDIFLACPNDRVTAEDFELDAEERKAIQPFVKAKFVHKQGRTPRGSLHTKSFQRRSVKGGVIGSSSSTGPNAQAISQFPSAVLDKYSIGPIIGNGNFAVVRGCIERKSKKRFALKVIDKLKVTKCGQDVPSPDNEITILSSISHPNIIVLFERFDFAEELYLIMEFVEGGDLFDAIAEVNNFSEADSQTMTKDIALALQYLHVQKIVHRDLKPENLMIHYTDDGQRRIKLGDFGLAQIVTGPMFIVCGTPTYVAPEILAETGYGLKVDIWALGVIVYALLCGYPPFYSPSSNQQDLFDLILEGRLEFHRDPWDGISTEAKDIIIKMINVNPEARFTAEQVLQHCWLSNPNNHEELGERQE